MGDFACLRPKIVEPNDFVWHVGVILVNDNLGIAVVSLVLVHLPLEWLELAAIAHNVFGTEPA